MFSSYENKIEDETLTKNLKILIADLSYIYGVDSSEIQQSGGACGVAEGSAFPPCNLYF